MLDVNRYKLLLNRLTKDVKVISFDVFDTILIRMLPSDKVAEIAAEELSRRIFQEFALEIDAREILRSRFQFKMNMDKANLFGDAEWVLSDWLNVLARKRPIDPPTLCRLGYLSELLAEKMCLRLAPYAVDALSLAKVRELRVIAVSDMWLDQGWLNDLLVKFGLDFDAVFSSGSMGASKRRGTIFRQIEYCFSLPPNAFVHIGDSLKGDFIRPRLADWGSIWMPHPGNTLQFRNLPVSSRFNKQRKSWQDIVRVLKGYSVRKKGDPYFEMAYNHLSPLLIIFSIVQWRRFRDQGIEIVFYLSRDAKAIYEVYDLMKDFLPGSCPRRYIRLSRRSVAIAHPDNFLLNVNHLAGKVGKKKISEWLSNFTISSELRRQILLGAGLKETDDLTDSAKASLKSACHRLLPLILDEQAMQKRIIKDYLFQQAGTVSCRRLGIVDSGWACTTQDTIRSILSESELVSGMYLGVSKQGHKPDNKNLKYGLLRDDFRNCAHHNPLESTAGVIRMWDTILREPSGTVIELCRRTDNSIEPRMSDFNILGDLEYKAADSIQKGIHEGTLDRLKGISLIVNLSETFTEADFETAATMISRKISSSPAPHIAKAIARLGFDEGSASGSKGSLGGISSFRQSVAWYPGLFAGSGLGWISPIMEAIAEVTLKLKKFK